MHPLELKIPPPVVALIVAAAMWMNSISGPKLDLPFEVRLGIAVAIAVVGVTFDLLGLFAFRKARTTINPLKPQKTSALVTSGIYRFSRNPMYVGLVGLLLAWAAYLQALWPLAGTAKIEGICVVADGSLRLVNDPDDPAIRSCLYRLRLPEF